MTSQYDWAKFKPTATASSPATRPDGGIDWQSFKPAKKKKQEPAAEKPEKFTAAESALKSFTDLATSGFSDEIVAGLDAATRKAKGDKRPFSKLYDHAVEILRRQKEESDVEHPVASTLGGIAGGLATAAAPGGAVVKGASLATKAIRGAVAGAGYGAAYGAGSGEDAAGRLTEAAKGAGVGALTGGAIAPVAAGVGKLARKDSQFAGVRAIAKQEKLPAKSIQKVS